MSDRRRTLTGFVFLILAMSVAVFALIGGWIGWDFRTGAILSIASFLFLAAIAIYQFVKIRDYAWLPAVLGGVYAVLPEVILGPADDLGAIVLGAAISGLWSWRKSRQKELS